MSGLGTRNPKRLAVLIDGENVSSIVAEGLFRHIAGLGEASLRRVYGDFANGRLKGWAEAHARFAVQPVQQFAPVQGKNTADIALVVDAMDLLYSARFDGFCLVSSDSDFTRLALRIREAGLDVFGFGRQTTCEAFRKACLDFVPLEKLAGAKPPAAKKTEAGTDKPKGQAPLSAMTILTRTMAQMDAKDGWVHLGPFGSQIKQLAADFEPRTYGHKKLSDLLRATGHFESRQHPGNGLEVRLKPLGGTQRPQSKGAAKVKKPNAPQTIAIGESALGCRALRPGP
ncbi:Uncharacterized conserved protein, LabA/DUF88 family [Fulvimarina manganoxydans]|uniref:Uncharacterized conserved protein, LabA/DUF88 family n=1 Tax=Fulvimarina manganoxydans TaxID=937218 RepID=A0A1W2EC65_9HYPH|nr:NYN domain-containing protein [Fulvimarina manganoxydans]SMD06982.1 Uncharacterized conserved protein, LabA/DUF88 family [Fulvimarina manganoxydans]